MIGVDLSPEMLSVLREKAEETGAGRPVAAVPGHCRAGPLRYGALPCPTFDTFNHIGPAEKFRRALCRCYSVCGAGRTGALI